MVPAHGQPTSGADKVEEVLRMYRDGIQFVHDQTIRYMNHGLTPDELANTVKLRLTWTISSRGFGSITARSNIQSGKSIKATSDGSTETPLD